MHISSFRLTVDSALVRLRSISRQRWTHLVSQCSLGSALFGVVLLSGHLMRVANPSTAAVRAPGVIDTLPAAGSSTPAMLTVTSAPPHLLFTVPRALFGADVLFLGRYTSITPVNEKAGMYDELIGKEVTSYSRFKLSGIDFNLNYRSVMRWICEHDTVTLLRLEAEAGKWSPVQHFPVLRFGSDSAPVIDVAPLFLTQMWWKGAGRGAVQRTTLERAQTFSTHVELDVAQTVSDTTYGVHWSMVRLPSVPMRPRLAADRMNFYRVSIGGGDSAILRWRLDKRDPMAAVSDVVHPIVFDIDPHTPARWVPWIKRGIEAWLPAFEAIGFRHAIVVREAPRPGTDTTWSLYDATHSAVVWLPYSRVGQAVGGPVIDPRTGEILSAVIKIFAGFLQDSSRVSSPRHGSGNIAQPWYVTWAGGNDPRARLPLADSVTGQVLAMLITHEVGHTLGFDHNFFAARAYPTDSLRSPAFVRRMGSTPSIMGYGYFNMVAQPDDHVPLDALHAHIGPSDRWALGWGYRPIPTAVSAAAERPVLQQWQKAQDTAVYLRAPKIDKSPSAVGALGDNPVTAARAAARNFARILPLMDTTQQREILDNWSKIMNEGVVDMALGGTPPVVFDSARQVEAIRYILEAVVLGKNPLVQAPPARGSMPVVPLPTALVSSVNLQQWRYTAAAILESLVARPSVSGTPTGVCPEVATVLRQVQAAMATTADTTAHAYGGRVLTSLGKLQAACQDPNHARPRP